MTGPETVAAVRAISEAIADQHGLEVVEVVFRTAPGSLILAVTLDKPDQPLSIEEIASVSEEISRALDIEDPIQGRYTLEVSSAGIERPLVRPADYVRFNGREINVRSLNAIEGTKNFTGVVASAGEESFVLQLNEGGAIEIPYSSVAKSKLVVDWDEILGRSGGKRGRRQKRAAPGRHKAAQDQALQMAPLQVGEDAREAENEPD